MTVFFQILIDSFQQALHQLWGHKLRTFLSLLGITIGIGCVIMVFSVVDSLAHNIKEMFRTLGEDVVYIDPMPWGEDPRENYWKYVKRPKSNYKDYKAIKEKAKTVDYVSYTVFLSNVNLDSKYGAIKGVFSMFTTEEYNYVYTLHFDKGRYFSSQEFQRGTNSVIIGYNVYETLFPNGQNPLGEVVKIKGQPLRISGVLRKQGNDMLSPMNYDEIVIMPYIVASKFININQPQGSMLMVKAKSGVALTAMQNELTKILRSARYLKTSEENNFEFNNMSILSGMVDNVVGVVRAAGLLIGIFSIIVGGFSVANIMFVSVKERTSLIGIKKALGAKRYIILMEFLIEAILLCLIGGGLGLVIVALLTMAASTISTFPIFLSLENIILGLLISTLIGLVSGLLPAYFASKMQPVEAIRA